MMELLLLCVAFAIGATFGALAMAVVVSSRRKDEGWRD